MNTHYIYLSFLFPLMILFFDGLVQLIQQQLNYQSELDHFLEQLYATQNKVRELELKMEIENE